MTLRTFIAVEIDPAVRRVVEGLIEGFRQSQADVKWVAFENLHITLQFLGDVPEEETATMGRTIAEVVADIAPFDLHLRGAGAFPNLGRPRTFWLGCEKGEAQLSRRDAAFKPI
jgi:2'-5' RNA ligase